MECAELEGEPICSGVPLCFVDIEEIVELVAYVLLVNQEGLVDDLLDALVDALIDDATALERRSLLRYARSAEMGE